MRGHRMIKFVNELIHAVTSYLEAGPIPLSPPWGKKHHGHAVVDLLIGQARINYLHNNPRWSRRYF